MQFKSILIVLLCCVCGRALGQRDWPVEIESGRFKIHADFEIEDQAGLLRELESLTQDVQQLLQIPESRKSIHIVLFETDAEYTRYMQRYFPDLPSRRALFIQDRGPGMLFTHWHSEIATDLRHEVAHALVNDGKAALPLWLDEGLAEYFEVQLASRFSGNDYLQDLGSAVAKGEVESIAALEQRTKTANFSDSQYRDSWAWVHFMLHRKQQTRDLLIRYLRERRAMQETFDLERALQDGSNDLRQEFQEHFRALQHSAATAKASSVRAVQK